MEEIIKTIVVGALTAFAIMAVLYALNCILVWREKKDGIRVVKKGKLPKEKVECPYCHSIIEYDTMKVNYTMFMDKDSPYIICPVCNEQIMLSKENTQTTK